jgi:surfeit locus 1 family protein
VRVVNRKESPIWRRVLPHLAALVVLALCLKLALWQMERAAFKDDLLHEWQEAPAATLDHDDAIQPGLYSRVTASGRFDTERHVLLDNQVRNLHAGVHVFTPFRPTGSDRIWMVNRGWQPLPQRTILPEFNTEPEVITIHGRLADPPRVGLQIGSAAALDPEHWPNLMTYFDLDNIRQVLRVIGCRIGSSCSTPTTPPT